MINIPEVFSPLLLEQHRYFVFWGGRGGGKSYAIADSLLIQATNRKIKVLCTREIQNSIRDSVHALLVLRIKQLGFEGLFTVTHNEITCNLTGSTFIFAGLFRNVEKIKSIPGITHCWVAEANTVSKESLDTLIPTIREENSCLVIEFNPAFEDDPVYQRFVLDPPPDAYVKKVSWRDNPFISRTLLNEKDDDFARRPQEARHIWDGELRHYGANVWDGFDFDKHARDFDLKELKEYKVFQALDPHTSFYSAAIWAVRWKVGSEFRTWICKEWPTFSRVNAHYSDIRQKLHWQGTVKDLATELYATETGLDITQRYIDTRFAKGFGGQQSNLINSTTGIVQDFSKRENGGMLFLMPQELAIDNAKDQIKKDMQYNTLIPLSSINEPKFYVSPSCKNVIRSLRMHRYEEDSEKELETYKDHSDCMRILWAGLSEYRWPVKPKARPDGVFNGQGGWMGS